MTNVNIIFLAAVALASGVASAITPEEKSALKEAVIPIISGCRDEFGYTSEQVLAAKKAGDINALNSCFYACFFKKVGFITEAGLFNADVALEMNKKYIKSEDTLNTIDTITKKCTSVNDESVTDGAKGCDRSKLLIACLMKEKADFSPFTADSE